MPLFGNYNITELQIPCAIFTLYCFTDVVQMSRILLVPMFAKRNDLNPATTTRELIFCWRRKRESEPSRRHSGPTCTQMLCFVCRDLIYSNVLAIDILWSFCWTDSTWLQNFPSNLISSNQEDWRGIRSHEQSTILSDHGNEREQMLCQHLLLDSVSQFLAYFDWVAISWPEAHVVLGKNGRTNE